MRVLMLGWEFPPHISGGLGTACFGLTQGLADAGVEVLFVVPRAHGDEDERFARVLGANQVPLPAGPGPRSSRGIRRARGPAAKLALESSSTTLSASGHGEQSLEIHSSSETESKEAGALREALRVLAIDSPLRPYLDEDSYAKRLQHLRADASETSSAGESTWPVLAPSTSLHPAARTAVEELARALLSPAGLDWPRSPAPASAEGEAPRAPAEAEASGPTRTLEFTGSYGSGLIDEVARYALVIGELARAERFDVIHAHDWMTYAAGLVAKRISGKPLVVHMHACEYDRSGEHVNERIQRIEQLGLDAADRIVCVSHYTANILRSRYSVEESKLRVVHNAVTHKEQLEGWHAEKPVPEPIVLFLGRVTFQKGPDYFLEAAARVIQIEPNVKFVMSGSGDMLPSMVERAARLGLARHAHFTGFLRGDDVERMYALADIYVMPSVSEPFGISPLEAMALDVPVIVSRQSGVAEVLRNALKVDFWDVQEIANKILALLRYPALSAELIEEGKEEIRRLRWDVRGAAVRDIYLELVR